MKDLHILCSLLRDILNKSFKCVCPSEILVLNWSWGGVAGFPFWFKTNSRVDYSPSCQSRLLNWSAETPHWGFIQHTQTFLLHTQYVFVNKWLRNLCMWLVFTPVQKGRRMDYRASVYFDHLWLGMIGAARNRILVGLQFVCNSVYRPICYIAVCDGWKSTICNWLST